MISSSRRVDADAAGGGFSVYTELSSTERKDGCPPVASDCGVENVSDISGGKDAPAYAIDCAPSPFTIDGESDGDSSVSLVDVHRPDAWEMASDEEPGEIRTIDIEEEAEVFDEDFDEEFLGAQLRAVEETCCPCFKHKFGHGRRKRRRKSTTFLGLGESRLLLMAWAFLAAVALAVFAFIDAYDAAEMANHHIGGGEGSHDKDQDRDGLNDTDADPLISNMTVDELAHGLDGNLSFGTELGEELPDIPGIDPNKTTEDVSDGPDDDKIRSTDAPSTPPPGSFLSNRNGPPAPTQDIAEMCSPQSLSKSDGYWKCGAACSKGECCFMPDWHPHYCATGREGDKCKVYASACKILERQKDDVIDESVPIGAAHVASAEPAEGAKSGDNAESVGEKLDEGD